MASTSREHSPESTDPAAYLPHRNPFLFIDRIISRDPGVAATATKCLTYDSTGFPFVLLLESLAQLGGLAAATREGEGGFLAAVEHAEFTRPVMPGDQLQLEVRIVKSFGRLFLMEGEINVDGDRVASARFTLGIGSI
jgi:3-hydroxyacyl-[acyl-carrier-protein] dehydratase